MGYQVPARYEPMLAFQMRTDKGDVEVIDQGPLPHGAWRLYGWDEGGRRPCIAIAAAWDAPEGIDGVGSGSCGHTPPIDASGAQSESGRLLCFGQADPDVARVIARDQLRRDYTINRMVPTLPSHPRSEVFVVLLDVGATLRSTVGQAADGRPVASRSYRW